MLRRLKLLQVEASFVIDCKHKRMKYFGDKAAELNNLLVAALAAAAEENIEVATVVKEVQARLQV